MEKYKIDNLKRMVAGILAGVVFSNGVTTLVNKYHDSNDNLESKVSYSCNNRDFVDCFDVCCRQDFFKNYYVLKLREAYDVYCNEHPQYKFLEVQEMPEYLLLKGISFSGDNNCVDDSIRYDFVNWNDNINNSDSWVTNVSLLRNTKDNFDIIVWVANGLEDGIVMWKLTDSYIRDITCLTNLEIGKLIEQYDYNDDVISLVRGNEVNVSNDLTKTKKLRKSC